MCAKQAPGPVQTVNTADPDGRFLLFLFFLIDCRTMTMMRFVVYNQNICSSAEIRNHTSDKSFVALRSLLHHLGSIVFVDRSQSVPVFNNDLRIQKFLPHRGWHDIKLLIKVILSFRFQHTQTITDSESRSNNQYVF